MENSEREIAIYALMDIIRERAYGNVALRRILGRHGALRREQKALITELVNGVLRNMLRIDYILSHYSKTPIAKLRPFILNNLRVGVYQMKYLDRIPDYAICSDAVKLAKAKGFGQLAGFVNGVLRNIARGDDVASPDFAADPVAHLAVGYSYQPWIIKHFFDEMGQGETRDMLEINSKPPEITIAANTLKTNIDELANILTKEGLSVRKSEIISDALIISRIVDIRELDSFRRGLFHIMDTSSILAIRAAAPRAGENIIDLCAAPGGKSFLAAYLTEGKARILARDIHEHKLANLREGAGRLDLANIDIRRGDAAEADWQLENTADLLIIDAPCSGLGIIRRRPDIKLNRAPADIAALAALQRKILENSWAYVRPGGRLIYSTCTLSRRENEDNFGWLLANRPFDPLDLRPNLPATLHGKTAQRGHITIHPQTLGTDGFFIAIATRRKED